MKILFNKLSNGTDRKVGNKSITENDKIKKGRWESTQKQNYIQVQK